MDKADTQVCPYGRRMDRVGAQVCPYGGRMDGKPGRMAIRPRGLGVRAQIPSFRPSQALVGVGDSSVEDVIIAVVPGPGEEGQDHLLGV